MMELILWRHAEAEIATAHLTDLDRPLTDRGHRQAKRVAAWLDRHIGDDATILASPAARCTQTAKYLTRATTISEKIKPGASASALLKLIDWPARGGTLVVVGHQPTLGEVAQMLLGVDATHATVALQKGAICWLAHRTTEGGERSKVVLRAALTPALLKEK